MGRRPQSEEALRRRGSTVPGRKALAARRAAGPPEMLRPDVEPEMPDLNELVRRPDIIPGYDPFADCDGYHFDAGLAKLACRFFGEELCHVKGELARQPFYLQDWQLAIVSNLFGWINTDGLRRYHEAFIEVARKNGKTPLAAGILLYVLFEDGEPGAEIYGAAYDYKQASLVFDHARGMVRYNPRLADRCKVYQGQSKAVQLDEDYSTYRVVCGKDEGLHGGNTHAAVIDELHTQKNRDLVDTIITSTGARRQPLVVYITTSDFEREGSICNEKEDYAQSVIGGFSDPRFLPVVFKAERADADEGGYQDRAIWKKANPNLGVSVKEEYLEREAKRAEELPSYLNTFLRLHLNIRTEQDQRWLVMGKWDECADDVDTEALHGKTCYGGLDLGSTSDLTSLCLCFPDGDSYDFLWWFWTPEANAHERERRDRAPYLTWGREGHIRLTPGDETDYRTIEADVVAICEEYPIRELAGDRLFQGAQLLQNLREDHGLNVVPFGQGFLSMAAPSRQFEEIVVARRMRHGGNPVARWMAGNVATEEDAAGNIKPSKKKSNEKIDGIVSAIMALGRAMVAEAPVASVYETRGVLAL